MPQLPPDKLTGKVMAHLGGWGFPATVQRRMGALSIIWNVFEGSLEPTIWALSGEVVAGKRPTTDRTSVADWIDRFGTPWPQLPADTHPVFAEAATAAHNIREYRHALAHGWVIPSASWAKYIRNPNWNGELRGRPTHDAHVDADVLDMAIAACWTLCQVVDLARAACRDATKAEALAAKLPDVRWAASLANEVRHLTALMNSEKY